MTTAQIDELVEICKPAARSAARAQAIADRIGVVQWRVDPDSRAELARLKEDLNRAVVEHRRTSLEVLALHQEAQARFAAQS